MLYMIVERFHNHDPQPVYARFRQHGRLAPPGVAYVSSWVDESLSICFQLMEAEHRSLLDRWIANWSDIVTFDVYPVLTSADAANRVFRRSADQIKVDPIENG